MKLSLRFNAILKIILSIFNILIPLFVGPYIIRMLSRTSYDTYTKASVEIQLFLTIATIGIYTYGIRSISKIRKDKEKTKELFSELFFISLVINFFFSLLYFLYITFFNNHQGEVIYIILMVQFLGSSLSIEWMNEALENYRFITFKSMIVKIIYIVAIFILVRKDDLTIYGWIVSFTYVLENLISFLYIIKHYKVQFRKLQLKRHLKPLLFIFLITNISLLYVQADKLMLGLMISDSAVTIYTIPNYIVTSIYNVVVSIIVVSIPRLNHLLNNNSEAGYLKLNNEIIRIFYLIFIPILVFVYVYADKIIILYGSNKYNDCILPLRLFVFTIFLNSLTYIQRETVLYLHEKEKRIIVYNLIGGIINFGSNLILYFTGQFRPSTAIITLGLSFIVVSSLMRFYIIKKVDKRINFLSKRSILYLLFSLPVILINTLLTRISMSLFINLVISFTLFGIIYISLLFIFKDDIFMNNFRSMKLKWKKYWTK